jgi:hypothetical protein
MHKSPVFMILSIGFNGSDLRFDERRKCLVLPPANASGSSPAQPTWVSCYRLIGVGSVGPRRAVEDLAAAPAAEMVQRRSGAAPDQLRGGGRQSAVRLAQRLDVVELGMDRIIAVIDHHVA